jgi:hypothetical protein
MVGIIAARRPGAQLTPPRSRATCRACCPGPRPRPSPVPARPSWTHRARHGQGRHPHESHVSVGDIARPARVSSCAGMAPCWDPRGNDLHQKHASAGGHASPRDWCTAGRAKCTPRPPWDFFASMALANGIPIHEVPAGSATGPSRHRRHLWTPCAPAHGIAAGRPCRALCVQRRSSPGRRSTQTLHGARRKSFRGVRSASRR